MVAYENLGALACTLSLVVQVCQTRGVAVQASSDIYFRGRVCQRVPGQELQKRLAFHDEGFDEEGNGDILEDQHMLNTGDENQHQMQRIHTYEANGNIFAPQPGDVFLQPSLGHSGDETEVNPLDGPAMVNAKEQFLRAMRILFPSQEDDVMAEYMDGDEIHSLSKNDPNHQLHEGAAHDRNSENVNSTEMPNAPGNTTRPHRPCKRRRNCHQGHSAHRRRHSNDESMGRRRGRRTTTSLGTQSGFVQTIQQTQFQWQCEFESLWKKLPDGSYPQYVRSGTCRQSRCMGGMYRCRPVYRQLRVLRRVEGMCVPLPQETLETPMEEEWAFTFERVVIGCSCGL